MDPYRGPALVGSRVSEAWTVRRERYVDTESLRDEFAVKRIEERKEADIPWFTQKANKVPRQGIYNIHVGHRRPLK